jgi:hypothetical protein
MMKEEKARSLTNRDAREGDAPRAPSVATESASAAATAPEAPTAAA